MSAVFQLGMCVCVREWVCVGVSVCVDKCVHVCTYAALFEFREGKAMNTSMQDVNNAIQDLKSMLNAFGGADADKLYPDQTGGEIKFTDNNENTYLGKTITINGTKYTFANDASDANNIDLSGISADSGNDDYAQKVMNLLKEKVDPAGTNKDFVFEDNKFSFPLYTINGSSTVLAANGVETGEPYAMSSDKSSEMRDLQNMAFATLVRSEERRGWKECASTVCVRWSSAWRENPTAHIIK